ncbi:MAG: cytochrome c [Deltaproteobacteria bacterium]|nr:cytochrome c [Deltaproteobacteria bacterium]
MRRLFIVLAISMVLFPVEIFSAEGNAAARKKIYKMNCSPCHGEEGKGDGVGARLLPVKPAVHSDGNIMNNRSDKYLSKIISKGGSAVGRSTYMPAWGGLFSDQQIRDLIAHIRSLPGLCRTLLKA